MVSIAERPYGRGIEMSVVVRYDLRNPREKSQATIRLTQVHNELQSLTTEVRDGKCPLCRVEKQYCDGCQSGDQNHTDAFARRSRQLAALQAEYQRLLQNMRHAT